MRAKEFTINIPINIKINGDGEPEISTSQDTEADVDSNPVFVPPLQQHLELHKAELGKESPVIDKLTQDNDIGTEPDGTEAQLARLKQLMAR
jgi:hypothetical protein